MRRKATVIPLAPRSPAWCVRRKLQASPRRRRSRVYIEFNPERLAQLGVPITALIGARQSKNLLFPGGRVDANGRAFTMLIVPLIFKLVAGKRALQLANAHLEAQQPTKPREAKLSER